MAFRPFPAIGKLVPLLVQKELFRQICEYFRGHAKTPLYLCFSEIARPSRCEPLPHAGQSIGRLTPMKGEAEGRPDEVGTGRLGQEKKCAKENQRSAGTHIFKFKENAREHRPGFWP